MDYYKYSIQTSSELAEILIALLGQHPFDTFQEVETGLDAYIPNEVHTTTVEAYVKELKAQFAFEYSATFIPAKNWNAVWESNFQPIVVDDFCGIRADFHAPIEGVEYELVIQPKMAFGTGHHATTYLMIQQMRDMNFKDKMVFDYGCGTGILAILAAKLGATQLDAIDIDEWAFENTLENAEKNKVTGIHSEQGTLDSFALKPYDIILANITFNVIDESLAALVAVLPKGGLLLTSGYFYEDVPKLEPKANALGLQLKRQLRKKDWMCVLFEKA